jgi:hypothetical protein
MRTSNIVQRGRFGISIAVVGLVAGCSAAPSEQGSNEEVSSESAAHHGACGTRYVSARHGQDGATCRSWWSPCKTIQHAVDVACEGDVVHAGHGHYTENVVISKALTLEGEGRHTVIRPALSAPAPCIDGSLCNGAASNVILVRAANVSVRKLTIDGDNPDLTSTIVRGGADLDARNGIIQATDLGPLDDFEVTDVRVKNVYLRGIYASSLGTFAFRRNEVENVRTKWWTPTTRFPPITRAASASPTIVFAARAAACTPTTRATEQARPRTYS